MTIVLYTCIPVVSSFKLCYYVSNLLKLKSYLPKSRYRQQPDMYGTLLYSMYICIYIERVYLVQYSAVQYSPVQSKVQYFSFCLDQLTSPAAYLSLPTSTRTFLSILPSSTGMLCLFPSLPSLPSLSLPLSLSPFPIFTSPRLLVLILNLLIFTNHFIGWKITLAV